MPDLKFQVDAAAPAQYAAVPQLVFGLRIWDSDPAPTSRVQSLLLNVQIRIEPTRRTYHGHDGPGLRDLFGDPSAWASTMRSLLWTNVTCVVPGFDRATSVELTVPCSFDFNLAATKYFDALPDGEIPLCFLFSGTIFYQTERGLQAGQISWESECTFRLPAATWHDLIRRHEPDAVWLRVPRETFQELHAFKNRQALPSWEHALARLLASAEPAVAGTIRS